MHPMISCSASSIESMRERRPVLLGIGTGMQIGMCNTSPQGSHIYIWPNETVTNSTATVA